MKETSEPCVSDIMDLLLDVVCVVDPQGRFISITGACERIFGYSPEEMIGRPMIEFVFHEDQERTLQAVGRIMNGYLQRYFENRYVRKDGRLAYLMWSARWSAADQVRVAIARDITERRLAASTEALPHSVAEVLPQWWLSGAPPQLVPPGHAPIPLSAQDYKVLLALATGGQCVSRRAIVESLGEDYLSYDQRRLDTQMRRLRRKVEQACGMQLPVATLRGQGYHFYDAIEVRH